MLPVWDLGCYIIPKLIDITENYIIFRKHIKCIFSPFTEVVGLTINLISETHDFCERREYAFNVFSEYNIITLGTTHIGLGYFGKINLRSCFFCFT
jgi:hypothetical protein